MVSEKQARGFLKDNRYASIVVLGILALGMLAIPLMVLSATPGGWSSWVSSTVRLLAMYAFTFIFMNIVTGALAPYFYAIFQARGGYLIHTMTGALGFLFALTHGLVVLTQRYYRGFSAFWLIGPVALLLLALTIWVALDRSRLKRVWRVIHEINYLIFLGIFIKAVLIGIDLKGTSGAQQALKVLFSVYVGVAALAVVARLRRYQVHMANLKKAAAGSVSSEGE